jgi:hypothetical protein
MVKAWLCVAAKSNRARQHKVKERLSGNCCENASRQLSYGDRG